MGGRKYKKLPDVEGTRRRPTSHRRRRRRQLVHVVVGVGGRQSRRQFFDGVGISRPFLNLGARDFSFANIRNGRSHCCGGWSTRPTSSSAGGKILPYDPYCPMSRMSKMIESAWLELAEFRWSFLLGSSGNGVWTRCGSANLTLVLVFFINPVGASKVDPGCIEFKPGDQLIHNTLLREGPSP